MKVSKKNDAESNLAAPTFLINQIAKIKESRRYQKLIAGFDAHRLEQFIEEVEKEMPRLLSEDAIEQKLQRRVVERKGIEEAFKAARQQAQPFFNEQQKIRDDFRTELGRMITVLESTNTGIDEWRMESLRHLIIHLKKILENWEQSSRLTREVLEFGKSVLESAVSPGVLDAEREDAVRLQKDYSVVTAALPRGATGAETPAKLQRLSGLAALGNVSQGNKKNLTNQTFRKILDDIGHKKFDHESKALADVWRKIKATGYYELEQKQKELNWDPEYSALVYLKQNRSRILADFPTSMQSVQESLKTPAGDMYFLKSCLVAANELRRINGTGDRKLPDERHVLNIKPPQQKNGDGRRPIYEFSSYVGSAYDKVHMEPAHYLFCQLAVEYLWQQKHDAESIAASV